MTAPCRPRDQKYEITPFELFFDLVLVFTVSRLSHHLLEEELERVRPFMPS
jgi:low temperature requirement protein LtrA